MGSGHLKWWLLPTAVYLRKAIWSGCTDYKKEIAESGDSRNEKDLLDIIKHERLNKGNNSLYAETYRKEIKL